MTNITPGAQNSEPVGSKPVQPTQDPTSQGMAMTANKTGKDFSLSTSVRSITDLKDKAPEVYRQMMRGLAQTIIKNMRRHQERLKQMLRKGRDQ